MALEALLRDVASCKDVELEGGIKHLDDLVANLSVAVPAQESINKSAGALRAIVEVVRTAAETRRRAELAEVAARDEGHARTLEERKLALWLVAGKHANGASGASPMRQQLGAAGNSRPGHRVGQMAPAAQWAHARVDAIESTAKECAPESPMTVDPMQAVFGKKAPAAKPKPMVTPKPTEVASQLRMFDELCPVPAIVAKRMLEGEEFRECIVSDLKEAAKLEKHLDDDVHGHDGVPLHCAIPVPRAAITDSVLLLGEEGTNALLAAKFCAKCTAIMAEDATTNLGAICAEADLTANIRSVTDKIVHGVEGYVINGLSLLNVEKAPPPALIVKIITGQNLGNTEEWERQPNLPNEARLVSPAAWRRLSTYAPGARPLTVRDAQQRWLSLRQLTCTPPDSSPQSPSGGGGGSGSGRGRGRGRGSGRGSGGASVGGNVGGSGDEASCAAPRYAPARPWAKEVLGSHVRISMVGGQSGEPQDYDGEIVDYSPLSHTPHLVRFDDRDQLWFHLEGQHEIGALSWLDGSGQILPEAVPASHQPHKRKAA